MGVFLLAVTVPERYLLSGWHARPPPAPNSRALPAVLNACDGFLTVPSRYHHHRLRR